MSFLTKISRLSRKRIALISIATVLLGILSWALLFIQTPQPLLSTSRNRIFLFLLLNIHTAAIIALLALIVRQSIKFLTQQRQKPTGSIFTRNLLIAFMIFSVLPTFAVFFMAGKLISKSMDHWFRAHIKSGLENGIRLHQIHHTEEYARVAELWTNVSTPTTGLHNEKSYTTLTYLLNTKKISPWMGTEISWWKKFNTSSTSNRLLKTFEQFCLKSTQTKLPFSFNGGLYAAHALNDTKLLITAYHYPEPIAQSITQLEQSLADFEQLRGMRRAIYLNYLSSLIFGTLLILCLAIWCAFYLARGIAKPIHELLAAMLRIQKGEYTFLVSTNYANDLHMLALGFNSMSQQLQSMHEALRYRNEQLNTILMHIKEAVFFINTFGRIIMHNHAAEELVKKYCPDKAASTLDCKKISALGPQVYSLFAPLISSMRRRNLSEYFEEINFTHEEEERTLLVHFKHIKKESDGNGLLVIVEDISSIVRMKKIQTWQAAAKQIAHEIKNPLTPILLSTQRIQRKYGTQLMHEPAFLESTETIINHVKIIKDLASHFAHFAQMPETVLEPTDANKLVHKVVSLYKLSYPEIHFQSDLEDFLPSIMIDSRKVKRALINLLDNAVRALNEHDEPPKLITISTQFKQGLKQVAITVSDNGPGLPVAIKDSLFVPHISNKTTRMGLGLTIVHETVIQSGGSVKLLPTSKGAAFQLLFPA